jgi:hypothetical protein
MGDWAGVVWDRRRDLPAHAEEFVRVVAESTATAYPGWTIRATRLVPRPPI